MNSVFSIIKSFPVDCNQEIQSFLKYKKEGKAWNNSQKTKQLRIAMIYLSYTFFIFCLWILYQ